METEQTQRSHAKTVFIAASLSILFVFLSLTSSLQKSPTHDEPLHLFSGYSYLRWGDFRVNPEHPPLAKMLAALPLLALEINTEGLSRDRRDLVQQERNYGWVLAARFIFFDNNAEPLLFYAKLMMIALSVVLGVFIFVWSRELYGLNAAIAALSIYCLDPNVLAHSSIVHTDLPFSLFFFAGTYYFLRTLKQATWFNLSLTSLMFALSAITKFSFLAILPIWAILGITAIFFSESRHHGANFPLLGNERWHKAALTLVVMGACIITAYLSIWAAYGFRFDMVPYSNAQPPVSHLVPGQPRLAALMDMNANYFILPEAWVYGLTVAFEFLGRTSYLLGDISSNGFWHYFPVAFAVKTPLPTLVMLLVALAIMVFGRRLHANDLFLLIPAVCFFSIAVFSRMNIGLRHILPIYPFLFVWIGGSVAKTWLSKDRIGKYGIVILGAWLVGSSLKTYPDYLAFFNEIVGGPANGHRVLVDSNIDWGQDLKGLKRWMTEKKVKKITFAYFGTADPAHYEIDAVHAPGSMTILWRPERDGSLPSPYFAISATHLAGVYLAQPDTYAPFRGKKPVATIGHSILVFSKD